MTIYKYIYTHVNSLIDDITDDDIILTSIDVM
jgi:hypothetical protein